MEPTWKNQLRAALALMPDELKRHASVSTSNRHLCRDAGGNGNDTGAGCFCCACVYVMRHRADAVRIAGEESTR